MNVNYEIFTMLYGMKFRRFMEKMLKSIEEEYELNKVDLQILFYLYSAGDKNSSKDIMELEMFTRGHISQSLGRLQKKGYVLIEQDPEDRRCTHNNLTERADEVIGKLRKVFERMQTVIMDGVTEEERLVLAGVIEKVNGNIDRMMQPGRDGKKNGSQP